MSRQQPQWIEPAWEAPPGVRAVTSLRHAGCSTAQWSSLNLADHCGDRPADVRRNREWLRSSLNLPRPPVWLRQVHGTDAVQLKNDSHAHAELEADAAWTDQRGVVCAILTADCLPVLLASADGSKVAAIHAGWRGLAAGVVERCVQAMACDPSELSAWLGPAIGPEAFEVGQEVVDAFCRSDPNGQSAFVARRPVGKFLANLPQLASARLRQLGVKSITASGLCTYQDSERFFSFRRDGVCGRMASFIWIDR